MFPRSATDNVWLSLNLLNSKQKIGIVFQEDPASGNSYILRWSSKDEIFITMSRYVSIHVVSGNRYLPRGSKENVLYVTMSR